MRVLAALYDRLGPAHEVLRVAELPDPMPAPGLVRVRMRVSGVNPSDWRARLVGRGGPLPYPFQIPHSDGAGSIDAVGEGVEPSRIGERVWTWHAAWQRAHGTAAQYVCLPAEQAVPLPDEVSDEQAAGLGIPYMTAWHCLFADGPIADRTVLVAGGAGAVGNAAVQLAGRAGATVVTTVSSPEKAELARAAGAHAVVNYRSPDAVEALRAAAPDGVARIVELALGRNLELDLAVANDGATIMTYAPETTDPVVPTQRLMRSNIRLTFMLIYTIPPAAQAAAVTGVAAALAEGALRPLPTTHFALHDVADAHAAVEGGAVGKVVVDIP